MAYKTESFKSTDIADAYVNYRPAYGPTVFEEIVRICRDTEACDFSLAVDLGCGSGQSTVPLTKAFKRVIGLDVSQAQVDRAPKDIPNLTFRVGPAEDLSFLENCCVDLVTVASAVHWMDFEKLFLEVERVLKPGGAVVVYGYGNVLLPDPNAQEIYGYFLDSLIKPLLPTEYRQLQEHYRTFYLPFPGWSRDDSLSFDRSWTVDDFVNYLSSFSLPESRSSLAIPVDSVLNVTRQRLTEACRDGPENRRLKVTWPVYMLKGHKPVQSW